MVSKLERTLANASGSVQLCEMNETEEFSTNAVTSNSTSEFQNRLTKSEWRKMFLSLGKSEVELKPNLYYLSKNCYLHKEVKNKTFHFDSHGALLVCDAF